MLKSVAILSDTSISKTKRYANATGEMGYARMTIRTRADTMPF